MTIILHVGSSLFFDLPACVSSEKKCPYKLHNPSKNRVQSIENANNALQFVWDCGVELKLKPQGTDLVDEVEKNVLGLIWAIMLRFLKFGDDTDKSLDAKTALLMWVKNKVGSYGIEVNGFGKDWHNGLALCAIIHKHRPKLIPNFGDLSPSNGIANLNIALEAAFQYFNLEKYITAEDLLKLDDSSMVVYVSEYYYGIAEQRKMDLAAKRIGKVIKLTEENDAMKVEYAAKAKNLRELLDRVEKLLEDRTIDNTMDGAKRRLAEFYEYKARDKNQIIKEQLSLEGLYNNLAMRLAHNQRPEFNPGQGVTLKDIAAAVAHIEKCEQERKIALHAELNRQTKLQQLDQHHTSRSAKLQSWIAAKDQFLSTSLEISSISTAELQLALLGSYEQEASTVKSRNLVQLKDLSNELARELYEKIAEVQARDAANDAGMAKLDGLLAHRMPRAQDDLEREKFKESVRLLNQQHEDKFAKLEAWIAEKEKYLQSLLQIASIADARKHLGILEVYEADAKRTADTAVVDLKALGANILAQKYASEYSTWSWEDPSEITDREALVDSKWTTLASLSAAKKQSLDAALDRELEKERLRLLWTRQANDLQSWVKDLLDNVLPFAQFGFTLEEVEAYAAELHKSEDAINAEAAKKKQDYEETNVKLLENGVDDINYTKLTIADLAGSQETIVMALEDRRAQYDTELQRQRANDALCKEFADLVEPLFKLINERKDSITASKGTLEEQLAFVKTCLDNLEAESTPLASIQITFGKIETAGITNNRHTTLTAKDVEVQFDQYQDFLEAKRRMLDDEIQNEKLKGITAEQMQEIEENFKQFDTDASGSIDAKELKACLYSLGEEKTASEIEKIMADHGKDGKIPYDGFKEFMIGIYGVSDTKDSINDGFKLINRGESIAKEDRIDLILAEHDAAYFKANAPAVEGGFNYQAWCDDVYAR
jgi:Ca2+-binding EF-hand superfamily protein